MSVVVRLALMVAVAVAVCAVAIAEDRPNVVLIISDDQTYSDFGFMGNDQIRTPHLDRLAARSARFVNGYVPSSVCRPSLATLLTGRYPHEHGIHFNHPPPGFSRLSKTATRRSYEAARESAVGLIRDAMTLPRLLAERGYRCLQTGKHWEGHWHDAGFTDGMTTGKPVPGASYGNLRLKDGRLVAHGNGDAGLAIGRETMAPIEAFLSDVGQSPFFIWYAPFLPHLPHNSPQRYFALYPDTMAPHRRAYYAACSEFDDTVGRLFQCVERADSPRETLYVFVVDNGFRPDPEKPMRDGFGYNYTRRSKRSPFENGLRTPILFAMDGVSSPRTDESLCSSVDIVPTVLEACSVDVPASVSGRSLWDRVTGAEVGRDTRPVFGEIYPGDATDLGDPSRDIAYRWVRQGDEKLIVPHPRAGRVWGDYGDQIQLYDLASDPGERSNLAGEVGRRDRVEQLRALLDRWWSPNGVRPAN